MKLFRDEQDHNARTETWKAHIADKSNMQFSTEIMHELGDIDAPKRASFNGTYNRFVDYTRTWLFGTMTGLGSITNHLPEGENSKFDYDFGKSVNAKQVWSLLSKAGKGGNLPKGLPGEHTYGKNENARGVVYDQLMPAYRAIRESFKSRPWYHWITDHANYTAERDAMHAIRGAIRALTGDTKEQVDATYTEYQAQIIEGLAAKAEEVESALEKNDIEKENVSSIENDLNKNEEKKLDDVINENEEPIKEHDQIDQSLNRVLVNDNSESVNNENNANEQEQINVNEEAQRLAELEAQRKAEEEAKRKAEEEEAKRKAEEEAKRKAEEEEAQRKAEEEAKRKAEEEEAQRKAEEEAKKKAEEEAQRKGEDEEAKKLAEAEENAKKLAEIKNTVEQIEVTDTNFKELCEASKENKELKAKVIAEFKEILGTVYKGNYIDDYASSCHYTATTVSELFLGGFNTDVTGMRDFVFNVFDGVFTNLDSLDLDADQKILTAQKITNTIVRNFPPVCHQIDKLSVYADNYIINGKTIYSQDKLKEILKDWTSVPEEEIDAHVTSINQAVAKPGDLDDVEVRLTGKDEPSQNKKRKPESKNAEKRAKRKVNKNSPFYSDKIAGDAVARQQMLRTVKEYLEDITEQTQAISEDEDEYLDDDLEEASSVLSENEEINSELDLDVNENEQLRTSIKIDINEIDGSGAIEVSEQVSSEEINKEIKKV